MATAMGEKRKTSQNRRVFYLLVKCAFLDQNRAVLGSPCLAGSPMCVGFQVSLFLIAGLRFMIVFGASLVPCRCFV